MVRSRSLKFFCVPLWLRLERYRLCDFDEEARNAQIMVHLNIPKTLKTHLTTYNATDFIPIIHLK